MYTNTQVVIDATHYPEGGTFCICPSGVTPNCPGSITKSFSLERYGFIAARVWSSGVPDTVNNCGVDGCQFIRTITYVATATYPTINPRAGFVDYMSTPAQCPYICAGPPCGASGNKTNFWQAVCLALSQNPLTGPGDEVEAQYVNKNFGHLGISATGCDPATINYDALNNGIVTGWANIQSRIHSSPGVDDEGGPWAFLKYTSSKDGSANWSPNWFTRALTATRLFLMNPNDKAVYYTAFTDNSEHALSGENGQTYKVITKKPFPLLPSGFWSYTVYDNNFWLYLDPAAIKGTVNSNNPPDEIHFAHTCVNPNCIPIPEAPFNIMLRGYSPEPSFIITDDDKFDYPLPLIKACKG